MLKIILAAIWSAGVVLCAAENPPQTADASKAPAAPAEKSTNEVAVIKTTEGEMVIAFYDDVAPGTVENFKKLARKGFYDGTAFHRIIKGFMIQGGDPYTKDPNASNLYGSGGPGYTIKAEFSQKKHVRGVVSMARRPGDPNSASSQFFICLGDATQLDGQYTVFGKLIKGDDVLEKLGNTPTTQNPSRTERSVPVNRAGVESVKIVSADSIKP